MKVKGSKLWSSSKVHYCSDSEQKMGDELATLMDLFHSIKKAGRSATLTLSTKGGRATIVKLEFELNDAKPSSSSTSSVSSPSLPGCQAANAAAAGDRHRHRRSAARRAKANARAAQHRAFQALPFPGGDYSAALGPPDPSPPQRSLHLHPSPKEENRRLILTVDRKAGFQPTFSQLDGDGDPTSHFRAILVAISNNITNYSHCDLVAILSTSHSTTIFTAIQPSSTSVSNC